jgi:hypothetical protein
VWQPFSIEFQGFVKKKKLNIYTRILKRLQFPWIVSKIKITLVRRFVICVHNWPIQTTKEKRTLNPYLIFFYMPSSLEPMINQVKMFDFILKIFFLKQNCVILLHINNICVNIQLNVHFYIFCSQKWNGKIIIL